VYLDGEGAVFVHESVLAANPELSVLSLAAPLPPASAPLGPAAGIWHDCDCGAAGRRGLVLGALGFPAAASADLSRALVHCPGNLAVAMTLGKTNAGLQRHAAAVPLLESGLQHDPMDLDAWLLLGVSRAALGRDAAAKEAWERAVAVAPNDPRAARLLQRLEEMQLPER
jgi:tetratricopeptide (TPR) repeat protein